jgi:hypothetical protein
MCANAEANRSGRPRYIFAPQEPQNFTPRWFFAPHWPQKAGFSSAGAAGGAAWPVWPAWPAMAGAPPAGAGCGAG